LGEKREIHQGGKVPLLKEKGRRASIWGTQQELCFEKKKRKWGGCLAKRNKIGGSLLCWVFQKKTVSKRRGIFWRVKPRFAVPQGKSEQEKNTGI